MALPPSQHSRRCFSCLSLPLAKDKHAIGVYVAGCLFALAHWIFWDAAILSARARPPFDAPHDTIPVHITFLDWIPGICSTLGLLVVNLINKERLVGDDAFSQDTAIVWRVRLFLLLGFALIAGGLAGSISVLVIKYILKHYQQRFIYYGCANVTQNVMLMLSAVVLWIARHTSREYEYSLTL